MTDLKTMLRGALGPQMGLDPNEPAKPDAPPPVVMADSAKPGKVRTQRTLADPYAMAEAQRIYNPQAQPVHRPLKDQLGTGTGPAMDMTGRWGGPK